MVIINDGDNWRDNISHAEIVMNVLIFLNKMKFNKVISIGHSMRGKVATLAIQIVFLV